MLCTSTSTCWRPRRRSCCRRTPQDTTVSVCVGVVDDDVECLGEERRRPGLAEALHRSRQPWPAGGRALDDDDGAASSDLPAEKSTQPNSSSRLHNAVVGIHGPTNQRTRAIEQQQPLAKGRGSERNPTKSKGKAQVGQLHLLVARSADAGHMETTVSRLVVAIATHNRR
jgi:hypothetical protein